MSHIHKRARFSSYPPGDHDTDLLVQLEFMDAITKEYTIAEIDNKDVLYKTYIDMQSNITMLLNNIIRLKSILALSPTAFNEYLTPILSEGISKDSIEKYIINKHAVSGDVMYIKTSLHSMLIKAKQTLNNLYKATIRLELFWQTHFNMAITDDTIGSVNDYENRFNYLMVYKRYVDKVISNVIDETLLNRNVVKAIIDEYEAQPIPTYNPIASRMSRHVTAANKYYNTLPDSHVTYETNYDATTAIITLAAYQDCIDYVQERLRTD